MKISKYVCIDTEVDINISGDDLEVLLNENLDTERLLFSLNSIAQFLNAVSKEKIDLLDDFHKKAVYEFFIKQADRFKEVTR